MLFRESLCKLEESVKEVVEEARGHIGLLDKYMVDLERLRFDSEGIMEDLLFTLVKAHCFHSTGRGEEVPGLVEATLTKYGYKRDGEYRVCLIEKPISGKG
ncbi:MAG: hypothetical protein ACXABY_01385 [Candidatus Thorarchaeota archaeon]|jgi:hypothetical protein